MDKHYQSTLPEASRALYALIGGIGLAMYMIGMFIYVAGQQLNAVLDWVRVIAVFLPAAAMLMALAEAMVERAGKAKVITGKQRARGIGRQTWSGMLGAAVAAILLIAFRTTGAACLTVMVIGGLLHGISGNVQNNNMKEVK